MAGALAGLVALSRAARTSPRRAGATGRRYAEPVPGGVEEPLRHAFAGLESGLVNDLRLVTVAESRARAPQWAATAVLRDLPSRYRRAYDSRFVGKLVSEGFALSRDWTRGRCAPDCAGQFVLARWLLDRAQAVSRSGSADARLEWARQLGLATTHAPATEDSSDPWGSGWNLEAIRIHPSEWFEAPITRPRGDPQRAEPDRVSP